MGKDMYVLRKVLRTSFSKVPRRSSTVLPPLESVGPVSAHVSVRLT